MRYAHYFQVSGLTNDEAENIFYRGQFILHSWCQIQYYTVLQNCLRINNLRGKLIPFWLISFFVFAFWFQKRFLVKKWQLMFFSCPVPARRLPRPSAVNAFGDFSIRDELKLAGTMWPETHGPRGMTRPGD